MMVAVFPMLKILLCVSLEAGCGPHTQSGCHASHHSDTPLTRTDHRTPGVDGSLLHAGRSEWYRLLECPYRVAKYASACTHTHIDLTVLGKIKFPFISCIIYSSLINLINFSCHYWCHRGCALLTAMGRGTDQDSTMFILFSDQRDLNKLFFAAHLTPYNALYIRLTLADSNIFDIILTLASKTFPGSEMQSFVRLQLHLMPNIISAFTVTKNFN